MIPNLFLLIYTASDYGFSNNSLIYKHDRKEIQKAFIWTVLITLSLTFNLLTSWIGLLSVTLFILFMSASILIKSRSDKNSWYILSELVNVAVALIFTLPLAGWLETHSYLRPPFVNYLLGLTVVSVVFADIFRRLGYLSESSGDSDGNFERILLFIFIMAWQWWYVALTIAAMLVYRFIRYRKVSKSWFMSPSTGIVFSLLWLLLMKSYLI